MVMLGKRRKEEKALPQRSQRERRGRGDGWVDENLWRRRVRNYVSEYSDFV